MRYSLGDKKVEIRGDDYFIAHSAIVIGSVVLENNANIWFNAVVRGDTDLIVIGENSNIQDGAVLHTDEGVELLIGKNVSVGHMAVLHGCTIGEGTLVGIKSVILNNAVIGKNCLIGANTLITENKVIPDRSLVVGTPGKIVRELKDEEISGMVANARHYVENFHQYRALFRPDNG